MFSNASRLTGLGAAAVLLSGTSLMAATNATATTDLNLRAGPSPQSEIVDVIPFEGDVTVDQCIADSQWCAVSFNGTEGWAYSPYLTASLEGGETVTVYENTGTLKIETYDKQAAANTGAAVGGLSAGGVAAALAGGPATIAGALVLGTATGSILGEASVPEDTVTYIQDNPVETVYLDGEVVAGAGIPEGVELTPVPDSDYRYVTVNGVPAVVNADRTVVQVVR
ncbi:SH3 domain-containing protein [Pseudooceanicola aestuarii]|uniref:SH3 domain-containing protein n=1 Tax=Pseudooceanicola aestuarii TaxID=2697319 RepID=UPI0013D74B76|nr:SH3 domain-containing protein [Pseudooceanicola aestuarii]